MSQYRFESTIRFIGFNAEEDGLVGSKDYVNNHVIPSGENIVGMINMDMILRPGSDVAPNNLITDVTKAAVALLAQEAVPAGRPAFHRESRHDD